MSINIFVCSWQMKILLLNIKHIVLSKWIRYFLKRKKFNIVKYLLNKKKELAKPMRDFYKNVNGREVTEIGYDPERTIAHIHLDRKFNIVKYLLNKKKELAKPMRDFYKNVNGREVTEIGYDPERKIAHIHFNHMNGGKTVKYYEVEESEYKLVYDSVNIAETADQIFKEKKQNHALTG